MRLASLRIFTLATALCGQTSSAQRPRDSWKREFLVLDRLTWSLANALVSGNERRQIYQAVDGLGTAAFSFSDLQKDEERQSVMSARVGFVALARGEPNQIVVQGPPRLCGAANCPVWIFIRLDGRLSLAFQEQVSSLAVLPAARNGFHDIAAGLHFSAFETQFTDYRWNGRKYVQADCYRTIYPRPDEPGGNGVDQIPTIGECP